MRSIDSNRTARAILCSVLLLSQHVTVDAKSWFKSQPSRSSTLAVAAPGGRDRPLLDWKAIGRNAKKKTEETQEQVEKKAESAGQTLEQATPDVSMRDVEEIDHAEAAAADPFDLEKATPQSIAILLGKVVVVATVGIYAAKKAVAFTKAFRNSRKAGKARKEAAEDAFATASSKTVKEDAEEIKDKAEEVISGVGG